MQIAVIGAGIGGLTTAVELARRGAAVTLLEAHIYPGGCAGTFFHQGYRFDAGATLAGGFAPGAPLTLLADRFQIDWEQRPVARALQVHLPDAPVITRWADEAQWRDERLRHFGPQAESFWRWQTQTAEALWAFAADLPPWPWQTPADMWRTLPKARRWMRAGHFAPRLLAAALRPVAAYLPSENPRLRAYVDGQLLISTQTTSPAANALYGAVALDLARQGVGQLPGGMGTIAEKLLAALHRYGGTYHTRTQVKQVTRPAEGQYRLAAGRGAEFRADQVVFNLPLANILQLVPAAWLPRLRRTPPYPADGWGAFVLYLGVDAAAIPAEAALHHQIIREHPLGEGNAIFLSFSPPWDSARAPAGQRALTISTHTRLPIWWQLHADDPAAYEARRDEYVQKILAAAEMVFPGLAAAADLSLPGTPVTFSRFTHRVGGWVGGYPQTNLLRTRAPRLRPGLWMVGDSIFPGQSVPAVALGGLRVAEAILA